MNLSSLKEILLKIIACFCCSNPDQKPIQDISNQNNQELISDNQTVTEDNQKRMFNGALSTKVQGQLFQGIERANTSLIQSALDQGAEINTKINALDPLSYAIRNGNTEIIQFLIKNGAIVTGDHIELAQTYQNLYCENLNEDDMVFYEPRTDSQGKTLLVKVDKITSLHKEILQYVIIEKTLTVALEQQKNNGSILSAATATGSTEKRPLPSINPKNNQTNPNSQLQPNNTTSYSRFQTKITLPTINPTNKKKNQDDDDDDGI